MQEKLDELSQQYAAETTTLTDKVTELADLRDVLREVRDEYVLQCARGCPHDNNTELCWCAQV